MLGRALVADAKVINPLSLGYDEQVSAGKPGTANLF
jgi:hypothetical protein